MSDETLEQLAAGLLAQMETRPAAPVSERTIANVVDQDFVTYRYLLEPADTRAIALGGLTTQARAYLDELEDAGASFEALEYLAGFLTALEAVVLRAFDEAIPTTSYGRFPQDLRPTFNAPRDSARKVLQRLYGPERRMIWELVDQYGKVPGFLWDHVLPTFLREAGRIHKAFSGGVMASPDGHVSATPAFAWAALDFGVPDGSASPAQLAYPFEIFPANTTNVGIALVFRQRWKPLGIQPGEVVRTIPLGPGQSQKVSIKITRKAKTTRTVESESESETTTEESDTTKDSSEIIAEASAAQSWNVSAEASYGGFGFGASVSAGYENSQEAGSKDTASNLSEVMKKTASKLRRQSKTSIVTETETGFEEETASEIRNPNDEVALTYYYHKLQHQYEVHTQLAEVRNVVFVAERVPAPVEINAAWVRRHDWILLRALKDPSFSAVLNELITDAEETDPLAEVAESPYERMMDAAHGSFAAFTTQGGGAGQGGLSIPDIYSEPQRQLDRYLRETAQRARANRLREIRRTRLYDHIRDNILHYCRAIWAAEDADQRLLRYRKEGRTAPVQWSGNLIAAGQGAESFSDLAPNGVTVPLGDLLDPTGPIGVSGNYIVFPLRQADPALVEAEIAVDDSGDPITVTLPLQEVLDQVLRAPYAGEEGLRDPALGLFLREAEALIRRREDKAGEPLASLAYEAPGDALVLDLVSLLPDEAPALVDAAGVRRLPDGKLVNPIPAETFGRYLHRRNGTRRFLVDSNNLYVGIHRGAGTALEAFKQAHRYIDVLKAQEEHRAERLKNLRRDLLKGSSGAFDPDIAKVVVVGDDVSESDVAGGLVEDDS